MTLRWERVDPARRTAHLQETKNGTPRTVPLSPAALRVLKAMPRDVSGRVFPLTQSAVAHAWERATRQAGIQGLRFHDLRQVTTSRLFEKGLNLMEVGAITGHKTLQMLKRYTHLRAGDLAARLLVQCGPCCSGSDGDRWPVVGHSGRRQHHRKLSAVERQAVIGKRGNRLPGSTAQFAYRLPQDPGFRRRFAATKVMKSRTSSHSAPVN